MRPSDRSIVGTQIIKNFCTPSSVWGTARATSLELTFFASLLFAKKMILSPFYYFLIIYAYSPLPHFPLGTKPAVSRCFDVSTRWLPA